MGGFPAFTARRSTSSSRAWSIDTCAWRPPSDIHVGDTGGLDVRAAETTDDRERFDDESLCYSVGPRYGPGLARASAEVPERAKRGCPDCLGRRQYTVRPSAMMKTCIGSQANRGRPHRNLSTSRRCSSRNQAKAAHRTTVAPRMAAGIATNPVTDQLNSPMIAQAKAISVSTRVKRRIRAIESHQTIQQIVVDAAGSGSNLELLVHASQRVAA
jgi:hypothetical protein